MNQSCELAWAAGFFDGEGTARFRKEPKPSRPNKSRAYGTFTLQIAQVHREPLDRFCSAVGGLGKVYGPYKHRNPNAKPYYVYSVSGEKAHTVLALISDYLTSIKRDQASAAAASWFAQKALPRLGNGRGHFVALGGR